MTLKRSATHLVLIPSYNPGRLVYATVRAAREYWSPVWVVVDGSDDGTAEGLQELAKTDRELRVIVMPRNGGKGRAVLHGMKLAAAEGFTHVLTMDSDGQHPAIRIPDFMGFSESNPGAMILGDPIFDSSAPHPRERPQALQPLGQHRDVGRGHRRLALRLPHLSDRGSRRRDAQPGLDAALRLRSRGRRAPRLARASGRQHPVARPVPAPRPGRRLALMRDNVLLTWITRGSCWSRWCGCRCWCGTGSASRRSPAPHPVM